MTCSVEKVVHGHHVDLTDSGSQARRKDRRYRSVDALLVALMLFALGLIAGGPTTAALISAGRVPAPVWESVGRSKDLNMILVFFTGWIGALYFWIRLRPLLRLGDMSSVPPQPPKPDMWSTGSW